MTGWVLPGHVHKDVHFYIYFLVYSHSMPENSYEQ